ncbi:MAG: tail fiber assembly protein [Pseudohongiellaceae bacterium]
MYRIKSSGEVKSQGEIRKMFQNTSLPKLWDSNVCDALGIDPVFESPKPEISGYTQAILNGVTQDAKGNWVQAWTVVDMFTEYTDEEGTVHTKEDQEIAYQTTVDNQAAASVRALRNNLLKETDWAGLSDVTMSAPMAEYRQALRDITSQEGFPHSIIWPTPPEH